MLRIGKEPMVQVSAEGRNARFRGKKGGYVRMMSRQEALIQKIDFMKEPDVNQFEEDVRVDRPLAYRFDFIEICGGAGKITRELSVLGWSCGPVLDLEASPHHDLSNLKLLQWIYSLLEQGRLDAFIVEPPCTTFSSPHILPQGAIVNLVDLTLKIQKL